MNCMDPIASLQDDVRRVATNKVKLRPTAFFAGDCALETRIIKGALRGVPAEGVLEDSPWTLSLLSFWSRTKRR